MDTNTSFTTEAINQESLQIDQCSTLEMLKIINNQDALVAAAVGKELGHIATAVDLLAEKLKAGGRMVYVGAGTSGRLGVLDASECPPTFSTNPSMVQGYIAGGDAALRRALEGCEDDSEAGAALLDEIGLQAGDVLVGITASGGAPYVLGAVGKAKEIGACTIGVTNNPNTPLAALCDVCIQPVVGPEVVVGSTRMKAGTAQKMVLNMLSTGTMIKLGKVYGNLMVDVSVSNRKLHKRALGIIQRVTGATTQQAEQALHQSGRRVKLAILMLESGLSAQKALALLEQSGGVLRDAIAKLDKQ